jgi:hypothetical protein
MAYTKEPEVSTHNVFDIPAVGSQTYTSHTRNWVAQQGQRYINCFPQPKFMVGDKPDFKLLKAPPLVTLETTIGITPATTGVINCFDRETYLFAKDKYIYRLETSGDVVLRETHETSDTIFRSMQKVMDYSGNGHAIVAGVFSNSGGYYAYTYNDTTDSLTTSSALVTLAHGATLKSLFVDGYHVIGNLTLGRVFTSGQGAYTTFATSTDYFVPEIEADGLIDIHKHKNTICCLGKSSIEFFYNNANKIGSPFSRHEDLTIKVGAIDQTKTIADGDDIYFIGQAPNSGLAVWRIRNFQAEKISDDYLNFLLNNELDVGNPQAINSATLGMIDIYGNVSFAMTIQTADLTYRTFVFNEKAKIWWEWARSDANQLYNSYALLNYMGGRPIYISGSFIGTDYWTTDYATTGYVSGEGTQLSSTMSVTKMELTSNSVKYTFFSKQPGIAASTAEFYTDLQDLDTTNRKHIKAVDAVGDYGDNTVELAFTKNADYSNWTTLQLRNPTTIGKEYPVRWTNLCLARQVAFRVRFRGMSGVAHNSLRVAFNKHLN